MSNYLNQLIESKKALRLLCEPNFNIIVKMTEASPIGVAMTVISSDLESYKKGKRMFFSIRENFSFEEVDS